MNAPSTTAGEVSVGFPERLVAYLIDGAIIGGAQLFVTLLTNQSAGALLGFVIGVAYLVFFWTGTGQTPGKMAMGIRVVNAQTGDVIGVGAALLRYVGYIVSAIPLFLGFLWIIWDPKHEGWHDKIASTRVVRAR